MNKHKLSDRFAATTKGAWKLSENAPDKPSYDQDIYCARLQGPMALLDGVSLNNRYYSRELWEQVLRENQSDFQAGKGLFGTMGHERELDEDAIAEGMITHKITGLWMNESNGTVDGEILVLNSPSGKNLNTYLRSGMDISVSTRAYGNLQGKTSDGADIIETEGFTLKGIDFVFHPGVSVASPRLVESVQVPVHEERKKMELNEKTFIESLEARSRLQIELSESIKGKDSAEKRLNEALEQNQKLERELSESKNVVNSLRKIVGSDDPVGALSQLHEGLGKWLMVPEFQDIAREVGMFDQLGTTMPETVKKLVESLRAYVKQGTAAKIEEDSKSLTAYRECGSTPEKIEAALDLLESFLKLDRDPKALEEKLKKADQAAKLRDHAKIVIAAEKIRAGLNLHESHSAKIVTLLSRGLSVKDTIDIAKSFPRQKVQESVKGQPAAKSAAGKQGQLVPTNRVNESTGGGDAQRAMNLVKLFEYKPITTPNAQ